MNIAIAVCSVLVALVLLASGAPKALGYKKAVDLATALGYSRTASRVIGGVEITGALGLIAGFIWPVIGLLAAIGCVLLMAGAVVSHLRSGDGLVRVLPAVVFGALAASVVAMYIAAI